MADADAQPLVADHERLPIGKLPIPPTSLWEMQLVRDVIYQCCGIDGEFIKVISNGPDVSFEISRNIPIRLRNQAVHLCEIGKHYRFIDGYLLQNQMLTPGNPVGVLQQSYLAGIKTELTEYLHLLATLESKAYLPVPAPKLHPEASQKLPPATGASSPFVSLSRLSLFLFEPTNRMKIIAGVVERCKGDTGGALAGSLFGLLKTGDPLQRGILTRLLEASCVPLVEMMLNWIFEGELRDPYAEFFISAVRDVSDDDMWRLGYELKKSMLPAFISEELGRKILRTGLTINFLRKCCRDQQCMKSVQLSATSTEEILKELGRGETTALTQLVDATSLRFDQHLLTLMMTKFQFMDHCLAIKQYLLLAQGDFIQYMMDRVGSELNRPAKVVSTFQLTSVLVAALGRSNSHNDETDIQHRLHVKLTPPGPRDRGWHVFTLEYVVNAPLTTILTLECMDKYRRIFNLLWRIKRVEHSLNEIWMVLKELDHSIASLKSGRFVEPGRRRSSVWGPLTAGRKGGVEDREVSLSFLEEKGEGDDSWLSDEVADDPTGGESLLTELVEKGFRERKKMDHFVSNLQSYVSLEAIEGSWEAFLEASKRAASLDELILAHDQFLSSVSEKVLLGESSRALLSTLEPILESILSLRRSCLKLLSHYQEVLRKIEEDEKRAASRTMAGKWGSTHADGPPARFSRPLLVGMKREMEMAAASFSGNVATFISNVLSDSEIGLQFLAFRLDFSKN